MPQRRLLYLDANRLSAYRWQGGQLRVSREFSLDSSGAESFTEYLARHTKAVFSILADIGEEGFQIEDVPFVSGKDRQALTSRRLAQYFYGTPYTLAASLGREKTGRRDEKMLFAALTQPRHFEPWLDLMRQAGIQLAGIYSAPLALASVLAGTKKLKGPQLAISISRSGVRQTFFNDGKLHFSRLTTLATGSMDEAAVACAVEARKIYQYLAGQRMVNRNTPLEVLVLAHPGQFSIIRGHCRNSADLNFEYVDLLEEARRTKLKSAVEDSYCETLLLNQLVRNPPAQQFAPPAERHFFRLWQISSGLTAAAIVVFASCLLFAGKQYFSTQELKESTRTFDADRLVDEAKYQVALKALPPVNANTDDVRNLVNRFQDMSKRSPLIESTLVPLSRALTATPGIDIQRIDWKLTDQLPIAKQQLSGAFKQPPLNVSGSYYAVADIEAQLPVSLTNDHRAMLALLNQFVAEIGKEKSLGVQMTQLPFDVESGKTIKSTDDASTSRAEAPKFSFRLIQGF